MKVDNIGLNALMSCETSWVQSFQILEEMQRFDVKAQMAPPKEKCELKLKKHEKVRGEVLCFLFVYLILVESHTSHVSQSFFGTFTIIYIHLPF